MEWLLTAPGWAVAGGISAIFGAAGGALGAVLTKAGFSWGRFASIAGIALGLLVAREGGISAIQRLGWNEASTERVLLSAMPEFYPFLKANFGSDYDYLLSAATEAVRVSRDKSAAARTAANAMADVRKKYANMIALAPLAELDRLMDEQITFYSDLYSEQGFNVCNNVALNGPIVLAGTELGFSLGNRMVPQVLAYFQAVAAAIRAPIQRPQPTDIQWSRVGEQMLMLGATEAQFTTLDSLSLSDPDLCPTLLLMMEAMRQLPDPDGGILKASYLSEVSGL